MQRAGGEFGGVRSTLVSQRVRVADYLRKAARRVEGAERLGGRVVWLAGGPRTGSTWLLRMLGRHHRVRAVDEPLIGAHLGVRQGAVLESHAPATQSLWVSQRERSGYVFSDATHSVWRPLVGDLVRRTMLHSWMSHGAAEDVVVIKEPHGSEGIGLLMTSVPTSKLLFLVRDPRDCADSTLDIVQAGWNGQGNGVALASRERESILRQWAELWRARVDAVQRTYDSLPEQQRFLIRYEDLRADPAPHLSALFAWLGVRADDAMVADIAARMAFERVPEAKRGPGQFHRAATPGLWRSTLAPGDQAWISEHFAAELARYGYDLN